MAVFPVFLKLEGRRGPGRRGRTGRGGKGAPARRRRGAGDGRGARRRRGDCAPLALENRDRPTAVRARRRRRRVVRRRGGAAGGQPRRVAQAAEARCLFVNAVDDLESASAYAGAIVQKAGVTIAMSTDGEAPALAGLDARGARGTAARRARPVDGVRAGRPGANGSRRACRWPSGVRCCCRR